MHVFVPRWLKQHRQSCNLAATAALPVQGGFADHSTCGVAVEGAGMKNMAGIGRVQELSWCTFVGKLGSWQDQMLQMRVRARACACASACVHCAQPSFCSPF
jgi:hypothetical protein